MQYCFPLRVPREILIFTIKKKKPLRDPVFHKVYDSNVVNTVRNGDIINSFCQLANHKLKPELNKTSFG